MSQSFNARYTVLSAYEERDFTIPLLKEGTSSETPACSCFTRLHDYELSFIFHATLFLPYTTALAVSTPFLTSLCAALGVINNALEEAEMEWAMARAEVEAVWLDDSSSSEATAEERYIRVSMTFILLFCTHKHL